jgi:hypothetical protein
VDPREAEGNSEDTNRFREIQKTPTGSGAAVLKSLKRSSKTTCLAGAPKIPPLLL